MELREYQQAAINACYAFSIEKPDQNPLIVIPTGGGKSLVIAKICLDALGWGARVLILSHVKELLQQNKAHIEHVAPDLIGAIGLYSASLKSRDMHQPVIVAGIQSVYKKAMDLGRFDVILVDECFVGGTKISTPMGERRIDNMRPGDLVYCASGIGEVLAISCRPAHSLVTVRFSDGTSFTCTPEHRIFTDAGWVQAGALEHGALAFGSEAVCSLWQNFQAMEERQRGGQSQCFQRKIMEQSTLLLSILCEEIEKPDEQSSIQAQNESQAKGNKAQADQEGRERAIAALSTACITSRFGRGVGIGSGNSDSEEKPRWISDMLQDRYSTQREKNWDRTRRRLALFLGKKGTGRQKNSAFEFVRVVDISRYECESPRPVYNLHVSGHPSYFANGKLVHNCHLLPEEGQGMYRTFIMDARLVNPNLQIIGFTATPYRMKTGYIYGREPEKIFQDVCYEISVKTLIDEGFLSQLTSKAGLVLPDLSGVKLQGGDYQADELEAAMNKDHLVKAACQEIVKYTQDRRSVLIFASGIKHGDHIKSELELLGCEVGAVYGHTENKERARILKDFKEQKLKFVVNVGVLTTGFDAPTIDCVALLRATMSPGLYYQMCGRALRKCEGKDNALILDFAKNVVTHGPIDMIKVKAKKNGKDGDAPMKTCPACQEIVHAAVTVCPSCGFVFERKLNHEAEAGEAAPISGVATCETHEVLGVSYHVHRKKKQKPEDPDTPLTMRVSYNLGLSLGHMSEWICIEHDKKSFTYRKAFQWWKARTNSPMPETVSEAVGMANEGHLADTEYVTVKTTSGSKFPEIIGYRLGKKPSLDHFKNSRGGSSIHSFMKTDFEAEDATRLVSVFAAYQDEGQDEKGSNGNVNKWALRGIDGEIVGWDEELPF